MKVAIEIEIYKIPKNCEDCFLWRNVDNEDEAMVFCPLLNATLDLFSYKDEKPFYCPLNKCKKV